MKIQVRLRWLVVVTALALVPGCTSQVSGAGSRLAPAPSVLATSTVGTPAPSDTAEERVPSTATGTSTTLLDATTPPAGAQNTEIPTAEVGQQPGDVSSTLVMWGGGDGNVRSADPLGVLNGKKISAIAAYVGGACAIADNEIFCWTYYVSVLIGGDTPLLQPKAVPDPLGVLAGRHLSAIEVGSGFGCVIADSEIYCWGQNTYVTSQSSRTTIDGETVYVPVKVDFPDGSDDWVTHLSATGDAICAIRNARLFCWGNGEYGRLASGATENLKVPTETPYVGDSGGLANRVINDVALEFSGGCASAGSVWCWGGGSPAESALPAPVTGGVVDGLSAFQVAVRGQYCATVSDGVTAGVACWGYSGSPGEEDIDTPRFVDDPLGLLSGLNVTQISSARGGFLPPASSDIGVQAIVCAIADGSVYCGGGNNVGQLGRGTLSQVEAMGRVDLNAFDQGVMIPTAIVSETNGFSFVLLQTPAQSTCTGPECGE